MDCGLFIQDCLAVKDQNEIVREQIRIISPFVFIFKFLYFLFEQSYIGKAAKVSVYLEQRLIKEVETIIEEEGKKSHHEIAAKIEELIENEKEQKIIADVYF